MRYMRKSWTLQSGVKHLGWKDSSAQVALRPSILLNDAASDLRAHLKLQAD